MRVRRAGACRALIRACAECDAAAAAARAAASGNAQVSKATHAKRCRKQRQLDLAAVPKSRHNGRLPTTQNTSETVVPDRLLTNSSFSRFNSDESILKRCYNTRSNNSCMLGCRACLGIAPVAAGMSAAQALTAQSIAINHHAFVSNARGSYSLDWAWAG